MLSLLFLCFLRNIWYNSMNWLYRSAFSCFVRQCDEFSRRVFRMQHVCPTCRQSGAPYQYSGLAQGWERTPRCRDPVRCGTSRAQAPSTGSGPAQGWRLCPRYCRPSMIRRPGRGWTRSAVCRPPQPLWPYEREPGAEAPRGEAVSPPGKTAKKNKSNEVCAPMRGGRAALPHGARLADRQAGLPRHAIVLRRQGIRP